MRSFKWLSLVVAVLAPAGCFFIGEDNGNGSEGLPVTAEIASASLAEDCAARAAAPGLVAGDCAESAPNCGICQQSTVQLSLRAGAARPGGADVAVVELVTVRVIDETGRVLDEISGRTPTQFINNRFEAWNEQVTAGGVVRASYNLEAPDWTRIGGGEAWRTRSMKFRIEVVLRIDGVQRTLRSGEMTREPEVVT